MQVVELHKLKIGRTTMKFMRRLAKETSGQDLVEYGLLLVLIALIAVAAITSVGTQVNHIFSNAVVCLTTPSACPTTP
jgi:Flp pilus assembly pilin Flp